MNFQSNLSHREISLDCAKCNDVMSFACVGLMFGEQARHVVRLESLG
jgi:hypothetical protein